MSRNIARVIIPDSHGNHIDTKARAAILKDIKAISPEEVIWLGDHLDCGGTFSAHQRTYTNEMVESYSDDCSAANSFMDDVTVAAPRALQEYLEGNHEQHVERWAARSFQNKKDADALLDVYGPAKALDLRGRGIKYYKRSEQYMGLSIPGTIRKGKCFFTHGIGEGQFATYQHLKRFGENVVHGHTHRAQSFVERTVTSAGFGSWCPGTLAKLQPLYMHTAPTTWSHGYGLQFVSSSGKFLHFNIPIMNGESLLIATVDAISRRRARR